MKHLSLISAFALLFSPFLLAQTVTNFNTANSDLGSNKVTQVMVASNGEVWAATKDAGVCVYDGLHWVCFNTNNSGLLSDGCVAIMETPGYIWIAHNGLLYGDVNDKGCSRYNLSTGIIETTLNNNLGVPHNYMYAMAYNPNGTYWFADDQNLTRVTFVGNLPNPYTYANYPGAAEPDKITKMIAEGDRLWISTNNRGFVEVRPNGSSGHLALNHPAYSNNIRSIALHPETNHMWAFSGNERIFEYDGSGYSSYSAEDYNVDGTIVRDMVWETENSPSSSFNLWFATSGGLRASSHFYSSSLINDINLQLSSMSLSSVDQKINDEVWVGHNAGVSFIELEQQAMVGIGSATSPVSFSLFPNPAINTLSVSLSETSQSPVQIEILNALGACLKAVEKPIGSNETVELDIAELAQGVYFVRISGSEVPNQPVQRFVKS